MRLSSQILKSENRKYLVLIMENAFIKKITIKKSDKEDIISIIRLESGMKLKESKNFFIF